MATPEQMRFYSWTNAILDLQEAGLDIFQFPVGKFILPIQKCIEQWEDKYPYAAEKRVKEMALIFAEEIRHV